jgi:hypothetical protein
MKTSVIAVLGVLALNVAAFGAIIIEIPDQVIDPLPGQQIIVNVTGGDPVQGANLHLNSSGAPFTGGSFVEPGLIFAPNNSAPGTAVISNGESVNDYLDHSITTGSGTVAADGGLYIATVDATGLDGTQFVVDSFQDFFGFPFPTDFAGLPATQGSGTITVTPEPASALLLGLAGLFLRRRRA